MQKQNHRMNVLVLSSLFPNNMQPNHGIFVKQRLSHFARITGHPVQVVAPVPYFPPIKISHRWHFSQVRQQEKQADLPVFHPRYFMTPKVGMSAYGWMMYFSILPQVKKIQKEFAFDLIDAHYVYPDGFAGIQLGRYFRKPVVVSARGSDINQYQHLPIIRRLLKFVLQRAQAAIAVSAALKAAMVKIGAVEDRVWVISNGIDGQKFFPMPKDQARYKIGLAGKQIILSVGSLIPIKGFDFLIRAFKELRQPESQSDLHLVIVGEGEARKDLEALIAALDLGDCVHLVGSKPHAELNDWYNAADLFCLLSSREGHPNVVMEALACGVPVLATPVGGIPEIIRSTELGLLTERNVPDIARHLKLALARNWQRDKIQAAVQDQTWEKVALELTDVFNYAIIRKNLE